MLIDTTNPPDVRDLSTPPGAAPMARATVPAFDPTSPDATILEAYEKIRAHKAWIYAQEDANHGNWPDGAERQDDEQIALEGVVQGNVATTIPGTIAKLLLLIPQIDRARWVDRCLCEEGFLALYRRCDKLESYAQMIAHAVNSLVRTEWEQALAAYEKSVADFNLVLLAKEPVDGTAFQTAEALALANKVDDHSTLMEEHFTNGDQISRVVRTLVPDHAAYLRKVDIIIFENFQEDATPWLVRDTNFLVGRLNFGAAARKETR